LQGTLTNLSGAQCGTVSGSFVFNADKIGDPSAIGSIDITTTAGCGFPSTAYTAVFPGFTPFVDSPNEMGLVPNGSLTGAEFLGTELLDLDFLANLTDLGGTVSLDGSRSQETLLGPGTPGCTDPTCMIGDDDESYLLVSGKVTSQVSTPEPSAFLLLGMGLVPLLAVAKRHR
jgi:hypothetical protein